MKVIAIAILSAAVAGCVTTAGRPRIDPPPASLMAKCVKALPKLPSRDATQAEIEARMRGDNTIYVDCAGRHNGLVDFIQDRDGRLTGTRR